MSEKSTTNLGIVRKRFSDFIKAKGKKTLSLSKKRFSKAALRQTIDEDEIIQSTLLNYSTKASESELTEIDEPTWMNDYRRCCHILSQVQGIMEEVKEEKAKSLSAVNEHKHRRVIQKLYADAAKKIQQSEKIFKGIEKKQDPDCTVQQRKIFTNSLMSLAMRTRQKAKDIRQAQQQDLKQRKQLQYFEVNKFDASNLMNKDPQGQQITEEGFIELQKQLMNERNDQILKIVSSIHSLNNIYKELQNVVIQQGSLLDRIDMNIETTAQNIKTANEHLTKAQEHQKSPLANRVIFVLILLIVIFTLILAFR